MRWELLKEQSTVVLLDDVASNVSDPPTPGSGLTLQNTFPAHSKETYCDLQNAMHLPPSHHPECKLQQDFPRMFYDRRFLHKSPTHILHYQIGLVIPTRIIYFLGDGNLVVLQEQSDILSISPFG